MKIIHEQRERLSVINNSQPIISDLPANNNKQAKLCKDCDKLKYCQYARNLSHNHGAHLTSQIVINGFIVGSQNSQILTLLPDQSIMAEKLKIRHKTCPFHRELSLG